MMNRVCMGWIAQKNKNKKEKERRLKEEDRRDQAGERLIFYIQRTENSQNTREHQRTVNNIREHQTTRGNFQLSPVETKRKVNKRTKQK